MQDRVLVTGGTGYVAGQLIAHLLAQGQTVHTTVRDLGNTKKRAALDRLAAEYPGKLRLFAADLLKEGSFDPAMDGCSTVHHVASPFLLPEKISDGETQMVKPALEGTRNILGAVNRTESVTRVVMTSTIGAIFGDYIDVIELQGGTLTEEHFNVTSTATYNPYHYSKVLAEQAAWDIAKRQARWQLVCINPGLVLGPELGEGSNSGSLFLLDELMRGVFFYGAADLSFATVDVREVAEAHYRAAILPKAHGRYIVASMRMTSLLEFANILREVHHRPILLPHWQIPHWLLTLFGPAFGLSQKFIANHAGIRFPIDNHRSIEELGLCYRPVEETLRDHYQQWNAARRKRTAGDR